MVFACGDSENPTNSGKISSLDETNFTTQTTILDSGDKDCFHGGVKIEFLVDGVANPEDTQYICYPAPTEIYVETILPGGSCWGETCSLGGVCFTRYRDLDGNMMFTEGNDEQLDYYPACYYGETKEIIVWNEYPADSYCEFGGLEIISGLDLNVDGQLSDDELWISHEIYCFDSPVIPEDPVVDPEDPSDPVTLGSLVLSKTSLSTSETGTSDNLTISLNQEPKSYVYIPITIGNTDEGSVSITELSFSPSNWNTAKTVTVTGVDDDASDGDVTYQLTFGPTYTYSRDEAFEGLSLSIPVVNKDDDSQIAVSTSSLKLNAACNSRKTGTFSVALTSAPETDVVIGLSLTNPDAGELSTTSLTFSPSNWIVSQSVTFTGEVSDKEATSAINLSVTNNAPGYKGKNTSIEINICGETQYRDNSGACTELSEAGLVFENGICKPGPDFIEFIDIPAGTFNETTINAFKMAKTETTVHKFGLCVSVDKCKQRCSSSGYSESSACYRSFSSSDNIYKYCNYGRGDDWLDHPMNCVTYGSAQEFCRWIGGRLPTADEWEYAATHDGTSSKGTAYPWGDESPTPCGHANYSYYSSVIGTYYYCDALSIVSDAVGTAPVGTYSPLGDSPLGLNDLIGNVYEFMLIDSNYVNTKGGDWSETVKKISHDRSFSVTNENKVGFRCVMDIE